MHVGMEETHQIPPYRPKTATIVAMQILVVPDKYVHVGLGYMELHGCPWS